MLLLIANKYMCVILHKKDREDSRYIFSINDVMRYNQYYEDLKLTHEVVLIITQSKNMLPDNLTLILNIYYYNENEKKISIFIILIFFREVIDDSIN